MTKTRRAYDGVLRHVAFTRNSVMLVMALFFIVMATTLAALIMANTAQLVRTTRHEHESIVLRQLSDGAAAWVRVNGTAHATAPVTLSGAGIVPENLTGDVRINVDKDAPDVLIVTACLRLPTREVCRTTRFRAAP